METAPDPWASRPRPSHLLRWFAAVTLSLGLASCGGDGGVGPGDTEPDPLDSDIATVTVTPSGGTFVVLDGAVTLQVPAGAVAAATEITVEGKESPAGSAYLPGTVFDFGPDGLSFAEPVLLTITFDPTDIPPGTASDFIRLHRVAAAGPELVMGSLLDMGAGTISGLIDGFSAYAGAASDPDALLDAMYDLIIAMQDGDQDRYDMLLAALQQDIGATFMHLETHCLASTSLSMKASLLTQMLPLQGLVQQYGLDDLTELVEEPCGGVANPGATIIEVTPKEAHVGVDHQILLETTIIGPGGQVLTGDLTWSHNGKGVVSVSDGGVVYGIRPSGPEPVTLAIVSVDMPQINTYANVWVLPDLVLLPWPGELTLATGVYGNVAVTVQDTSNSVDVSEVPVEWTILQEYVASVGEPDAGPPASVAVHAVSLGETFVRACAKGFGPGSCTSLPVTVVYNVMGLWEYEETLVVDLGEEEDAYWGGTEVCRVSGLMMVDQSGDTYSGTATERMTCTYTPNSGGPPVDTTIVGSGDIRDGVIDGRAVEHIGLFFGGGCRTKGTISAGDQPGYARNFTGTVECIDGEDYYSHGPSTGTWLQYEEPGMSTSRPPAPLLPRPSTSSRRF